jgi:hypothetical protein
MGREAEAGSSLAFCGLKFLEQRFTVDGYAGSKQCGDAVDERFEASTLAV